MGICFSACAGSGSKNAPVWEGMFTWVIPAASGPGISVVAILNADKTYRITYHYIDRGTEVYVFTGSFEWNEKTKTVTLDNSEIPPYYLAGKNTLTQLDGEGNKITGPLADNYQLRRVTIPR